MAIYQLGFTSAPLSTINLADTDSYIYKTTAVASPDTLIAQENGICNTIYVYKRSDKAAAGVVGVYDSSGNLLSSASFSNDNGLTGFFAITIPQFLITAGQKYEPVIVYTGATQYALYDSTAGNECSRLGGVSALPNPWTEPQNRTYLGGVYLEYESSGSTTHTVTYDGNSNTGGAVPVDGSSPYADGASVSVLGNTGSLTKTGYSFTGWNSAADGTGTHFDASDTFNISANVTLYAEWETISVTHTVTYNGNANDGGTAPTDPSSPYADGSSVTVLGNTGNLTKSGYSFTGWNTAADGSGTHYDASDTFNISATVMLYAEWETATTTYTVTYDGNSNTGGTIPIDGSSPYADGASVTVLGNTESLTRTGYVFVCWNTAADGTGANFESGDSFYLSTDTTLYALWKTEAELIDAYLNPPSGGGMILMPRIYGG